MAGILIANAQAFTWETSHAYSSANAGSVRLRKRLQRGVSIGGTYTFSKSIDDASSIGNGVAIARLAGLAWARAIVAQNPFDPGAERGLSSFDQRHRFAADYLWELPFGHDKRWLSSEHSAGAPSSATGSGAAIGPLLPACRSRPRVLGDFTDVNRGTNGTIRADVVPGPVRSPCPILPWRSGSTPRLSSPPPDGSVWRRPAQQHRRPGQLVFDMAFTKVFPLGEMRMLEFRASASNIFNHPQFTDD